MTGGFIALHRQILDWEWYKDTNTKVLFLHLLLKANYKDTSFEGRTIPRGQFVTSLASLASQTGLSVRQVRVSLDKLKMTGEVTSTAYARYRIITVTKYDEYQDDDRLDDRLMTSRMSGKRQADDKLVTSSRQADDKLMTTCKQYNNNNKGNKGTTEQESGKTAKRFTPPSRGEIEIFLLENGLTIDVDRFLNYYESNGWMVGRNHMKDWQATVRNWAKGDQERKQKPAAQQTSKPAKQVIAQDYEQRDYDEQQKETEDWMRKHVEERLRQMRGGQ